MDLKIFINVVVGAGLGTAVTQIILKLFLSHWLKQRFYKFELMTKDRRGCAEEMLDLVSLDKYQRWEVSGSEVYIKAYSLSDRLISINEAAASKLIDQYVSGNIYLNQLIIRIMKGEQKPEISKDFIEKSHQLDEIRSKIVKVASDLKK